jgi:hypothetical protein
MLSRCLWVDNASFCPRLHVLGGAASRCDVFIKLVIISCMSMLVLPTEYSCYYACVTVRQGNILNNSAGVPPLHVIITCVASLVSGTHTIRFGDLYRWLPVSSWDVFYLRISVNLFVSLTDLARPSDCFVSWTSPFHLPERRDGTIEKKRWRRH